MVNFLAVCSEPLTSEQRNTMTKINENKQINNKIKIKVLPRFLLFYHIWCFLQICIIPIEFSDKNPCSLRRHMTRLQSGCSNVLPCPDFDSGITFLFEEDEEHKSSQMFSFFVWFSDNVHSVCLAFGKLSQLSLTSGPNLCYISSTTRNDSSVLRCQLILSQM